MRDFLYNLPKDVRSWVIALGLGILTLLMLILMTALGAN